MGLIGALIDQFREPRGLLGEFVGHWMARVNAGVNRMAVEMLDVQPGDHVLEIGFGHGRTVRALASRAGNGFVAGIDPSTTMIRQATRRNRGLIRAGQVELRNAVISAIPYESGRFDRVLTVHTIYFWPAPADDLREVRRVMHDGGRLVVGFRAVEDSEGRLMVAGHSAWGRWEAEKALRWLEDAGFKDVRVEVRKVRYMTGACIIARR